MLSVFAILPFFDSGFFPIHDSVQVTRVFEMAKSLSSGMFPVRWVADLGYGYGYPLFNFYSVPPYYMGGVLVLIGLSALFATKVVFVFAIILSGVSMYFFVKQFFGNLPALVSSLVYLYFPYHAVNIYVRGDLAELFAYAFLPLVFLFLFKLHYLYREKSVEGKRAVFYILGLSLSLALVVISHNLSFFILMLFVVPLMVVSFLISSSRKYLAFVYISSLSLAFLLSSFYAIPAVLEMGYTNVLSQVGGGAHYPDHFVCIGQLWDSVWGFGGSTKGCLDGMSFRLGKVNIVFSIFSLAIYLFWYRKFKKTRFIINTSFLFLFVSTFMILPYSLFIWKLIPFVDFLQFPWRFLNISGFFVSVTLGIFVFLISSIIKESLKYLTVVFVALIILSTFYTNTKLFTFQQQLFLDSNYFTSTENIKNIFSKISDEYLPSSFENKAPAREGGLIMVEVGKVDVLGFDDKRFNRLNIEIDAKTNSSFFVNRTFFPSWKTYVNGEKTNTFEKDGKVYFSLPKGEYSIDLILSETKIEIVANILSLIGIVTIVVVIISRRLDKFYAKKTS